MPKVIADSFLSGTRKQTQADYTEVPQKAMVVSVPTYTYLIWRCSHPRDVVTNDPNFTAH